MEFQDRGAPHFHLFLMMPGHTDTRRFRDWCRASWAAVVADDADHRGTPLSQADRDKHSRAGTSVDFSKASDCRDPKRLCVYFGKHGAKTKDDKEYQHNVPAAWRTERVNTTTGEMTTHAGVGPGRFWGYWGLAVAAVEADVTLADYFVIRRTARRWAASKARYFGRRAPRSLGAGGGLSGGWIMVNDAPNSPNDSRARYSPPEASRGFANL